MPKFYITGVSGVGKSTVVGELKNRGIVSYDIDSVEGLCHWRNKATGSKADYYSGVGKDWLEAHEWICDTKKLQELVNSNENKVVIAGVASNQDKYLHLFDKIFLLYCKEETFLLRLSTRTGDNDFARGKSEQEHILSWYKDYQDSMIKKGAVAINTEDPLATVVDKIIDNMKSK